MIDQPGNPTKYAASQQRGERLPAHLQTRDHRRRRCGKFDAGARHDVGRHSVAGVGSPLHHRRNTCDGVSMESARIYGMNELRRIAEMHMCQDHVGQHRPRSAAVKLTDDCVERGTADPESSAFVPQHISPSTGTRCAPLVGTAVGDRSGSRNDDDAGVVAGAGDKCNQGVIDNEGPGLETEATHDAPHCCSIRLPVDACNAEADGGRLNVAIADRLLHYAMQHLLDFELARRLQVRAAASHLGDDATALVRQNTNGLRSARIDAEHVHIAVMVHSDEVPPLFNDARRILTGGVIHHAFPAAVIEVGGAAQMQWREAFGTLTYAAGAPETRQDTVFDLASLTKVLATTPLVMRQVERGAIGLDDPVAQRLPGWRGEDREQVTIRDLLAHCSGLPAHDTYFLTLDGREAIEQAICATPLAYTPRSRSIYSDLGFMLLGFILEDMAPLPLQFETLRGQMQNPEDLQFHPPDIWKKRTAPTRHSDWRGRLLVGEVDDDNTWALGGAAGQAGLFGTAAAVGACARHVMQVLAGRVGAFQPETIRTFVARRLDVPGSSRALGWDTMLPTSSCGTRMSARAFGHTGYTGTSLWIDPERDVYVVLLTNRVHPDASNDAIQEVRRAVHDAVMIDL